jgi:hypothetical protein
MGALALARRTGFVSWRAAAVLLLVPLTFTAGALFTGRVYAPIDIGYNVEPLASMARRVGVTHIANPALSDVPTQFIPWNAALRWALAHHEWPLWNPFELCGNVLAAAAQSAPYHPVTLISLLLPAADGLTFVATMTYFLAALSAFLFFRTFCSTEEAALFGAIGWCFSQHVASFILTAHGAAIAIAPLVLFGIHEIARGRGVITLVVALTLITLCGHPETSLHVGALAFAFVLVHPLRDVPRLLARFVLAGVVTALLTAIFLLPLMEALPQTREFQHRESAQDVGKMGNPWPVVIHLLRADVVPFVEGAAGVEVRAHPTYLRHEWAGTAYCGAILFAPAVYAIWRVRSRLKWFFIGVVIFGLLAGAEAPGVTHLLRHLPLFNIAVNARMIALAAFGVCALAAMGADHALTTASSLDVVYLITGSVLLLLALMWSGNLLSNISFRTSAAREVVPLLLAFACLRLWPSPRLMGLALIALLLLQRATEAGGLVPTVNRRALAPPIPGVEMLRRDPSLSRMVGVAVLFTPNTPTEYALEDPRGYQAMTFARLAETYPLWSVPQAVWSNRVDDLSKPFLSLMNVRYAFAPPGKTVPWQRWHMIATFPNYQILENDRVLPRAFVPSTVHIGRRSHPLLEMALCPDFGSEAWIETSEDPTTRSNGPGRVSARASGSRLFLHASMNGPGWVVVSETAWEGWRVLRGRERLKIHFADRAFIGFYLPPGEHDLMMEYRPRGFVTGASITAVAIVLVVVYFCLLHVGILGSRSRRAAALRMDESPPRSSAHQ